MATEAEVAAMRRALQLATDPTVPHGPNPRVGCVLLDEDGRMLAEGHHRGAGTPHAEVDALRHAGGRARGATAVVSLEPCAHTGRTGPCAPALVEAGVRRVVYAQTDANPVAAGGAELLRSAGVDVEGGVLVEEAEQVNLEWTFATVHGRPFVTWKTAASLDGRVAAADGSSRWITSEQARADVHAWRARVDAVLVGTGTVLADYPRLTVRQEGDEQPSRQPLRVVMGRRPLPPSAHVLDSAAPTAVLATHDPAEALAELRRRGVQHVYLEGGPTLAGAFVGAGLVDRVVAYYAPRLLGAGLSALADAGVGTLRDAPTYTISDIARIGPDIRVTAYPHREKD